MQTATFHFKPEGELTVNAGDPWAVAPMVAVRAMQLNGENLGVEEIEKSQAAWDGVPITIPTHPTVNGRNVSVQDAPWFAAGYFKDAHMDGDRLKGNAYLPVGHRADIDEVIEALKTGQGFDVSTGYFANSSERDGAVYQTDIEPDHIAILLNEQGACSWQDGCGIPRTNHSDKPCSCHEDSDAHQEDEPMSEDVMTPEVNSDEEAVSETPTVDVAADVAAVVAEAIDAALAPIRQQLAGFAAKLPEIEDAVSTVKANAAAQRAQLEAEIKANSEAWAEADLSNFSLEQLETLAATVRPVQYAGRGAGMPAANVSEWEDYDAADDKAAE